MVLSAGTKTFEISKLKNYISDIPNLAEICTSSILFISQKNEGVNECVGGGHIQKIEKKPIKLT